MVKILICVIEWGSEFVFSGGVIVVVLRFCGMYLFSLFVFFLCFLVSFWLFELEIFVIFGEFFSEVELFWFFRDWIDWWCCSVWRFFGVVVVLLVGEIFFFLFLWREIENLIDWLEVDWLGGVYWRVCVVVFVGGCGIMVGCSFGFFLLCLCLLLLLVFIFFFLFWFDFFCYVEMVFELVLWGGGNGCFM